MAKLLAEPKYNRRIQKRVVGFSDWEIDASKQLLQFSLDYKAMLGMDKPNKETSTNEYHKSKQRQGNHFVFFSVGLGEDMFSDEEDAHPKRFKKRFRPIDHIYKSTRPMLVDVANAKKRRHS